VICENAFTDDSKTNCRKICKKLSCKVELKKRYQANYRKTGKTTARSAAATRMPAANPADPNLTDEQRRNILAAREMMIEAAAQRHREEI
jgi:hypothetical protein